MNQRSYETPDALSQTGIQVMINRGVPVPMRILVQPLSRLWRRRGGQDLIEYALMAGLVAVSAVAVMPGYANAISQIFSKANSVLEHQSGS